MCSLLWPGLPQKRIHYHSTVCGINYQILAVMLPKYPNGQLLVAVNHNQLCTMASEMVDPINWPLPPHFTGQYSLSTTCTVQIGAASASPCGHWEYEDMIINDNK